jgi:hypothetical protein
MLAAMMNDIDLRTALIENLSATYRNDPQTFIVEEMSLCEGKGRIDVAVVHVTLDGSELKSDRDRLDRLARQSEIYGAVFERDSRGRSATRASGDQNDSRLVGCRTHRAADRGEVGCTRSGVPA